MSRPVSRTETLNVIPSGYTGASNLTEGTGNYVPANAYHDHTYSGNYARWQLSSSNTSTVCYVYYTFDTSSIPSDATITSVTAQVKAYRNNRVTSGTSGVQLYANTTAKGSATTRLSTSATTVNITNGGSWTRSEINNLRLRLYGVRSSTNQTGYLYLYGATVTINYTISGTEYEVTVSNTSPVVTTDPTGTDYVFQGGSKEIAIYTDYIDEITVTDNNTNIKNSLVEHSTSSKTISLIPNSLVDSSGTVTDSENGLTDTSSDTYSQLLLRSGTYMEYSFDTSGIPSDAVIDSVSCRAKGCVYGTSSNYANVQLYSGSTAKGSTTNLSTNGTVTTIDLTCGTWTRSEISDTRIRITSTYTRNNNYYAYFYGAELTIVCTINQKSYTYTISNIAADHTIAIADIPATNYTITASSSYSGATVSPSTQSIREGRDATVEITVNDISEIVVKDNNTVVTGSLVQISGGYSYTITNVRAAHTITVEEAPYYSITGTSSFAGASFANLPKKVYIPGEDYTVSMNIDNIYSYRLTDNNVDVTSQVIGGGASGMESCIPSSYLSGSAAPTDPNNALTDTTSNTYAQLPLQSGGERYWFYQIGTDNIPKGVRIISVTCRIRANVSSTSSSITNKYVQLYSGETAKGSAYTIPTSDSTYEINCGTWTRDELEDCKIRLTATYSNSSGYYINFYGAELIVEYEGGYNIQNIRENHVLALSENTYYSLSGSSTLSGVSFSGLRNKIYDGEVYTATISGVSNIYAVKLLDNNVDVTESIEENNGTYTYTINGAHEAHTLSISEQTKYSVTASSSYQGATVRVSSNSVYKGDSFVITVDVSDIGLVSVSDNGTMITGLFSSTSPYTCTIYDVQEAHTVLVTEKIVYQITVTDVASNGDIVPTGNLTVEAGYDSLFKIITDDINSILLQDGNELANNDIIYHEALYSSSTCIPSVYLSEESSYSSQYSGYPPENGLTDVSSSTYCRVYANTGSNAESRLVYQFDCSSIPEDAVIDEVSCEVRARVNNTSYLPTRYSQLYYGNTARGSQSGSMSTTNTTQTISNGGTWTRTELNNIRLAVIVSRGTSNVDTSADFRFYGATLTVNYHIDAHYTYEIRLVSDDHNLILRDWPEKLIYVKQGNRFILPIKIFEKVSGGWVDKTNDPSLIDTSKIYINKE